MLLNFLTFSFLIMHMAERVKAPNVCAIHKHCLSIKLVLINDFIPKCTFNKPIIKAHCNCSEVFMNAINVLLFFFFLEMTAQNFIFMIKDHNTQVRGIEYPNGSKFTITTYVKLTNNPRSRYCNCQGSAGRSSHYYQNIL